jgi:hypothetical protein
MSDVFAPFPVVRGYYTINENSMRKNLEGVVGGCTQFSSLTNSRDAPTVVGVAPLGVILIICAHKYQPDILWTE